MAVTLHNPAGQEGRITAVSYAAHVDGVLVDEAIARVPSGDPVVVPPKDQATVRFPVDLPEDFILDWWPAYMKAGEDAELRIQGSVDLRRDDGIHPATFEWRSSWTGQLADHLTSAVRNCDPVPTDLCMADSEFFWKDGALHATLKLHNPGPETLSLRNSTVRLLFGERAVVSGNVDLARELRPGSDIEVDLALSFSQQAVTAWWPEHVARCERTPLSLGMQLQAHTLPDGDDPGEAALLQWTFPAAPFETRFVCAQ